MQRRKLRLPYPEGSLTGEYIERLLKEITRGVDFVAEDLYGLMGWTDFPPNPIITARLGSTAPTLATFLGNVEQYTFDAANDYVLGATEIPHGWEEGGIIYPHIHWATNGLEVAAKGVKWVLEYTIANGTSVFPATTTLTVDAEIPASTPDRTQFITDFSSTISGTSFHIGAYLVWRLSRTATAHAGGAPAADPFALAIGFHGFHNTIGSLGVITKG